MARATITALADRRPAGLSRDREEFEHHCQARNLSARTIRSYRDAILALEAFLDRTRRPSQARDIRRQDIEAYQIDQRARGLSENTVAIHHRSLRSFFNFLVREEYIERSPLAGLPQPKADDTNPAVLSDEALVALMRACAGRTIGDRRDLAIISMFADSGVRLGEMASMRMDQLDRDGCRARVTGKTGPRIVAFGPETRRDLDRYLRLRDHHKLAYRPELWLGPKGGLTANGIGQLFERRAQHAGVRPTRT